MTPPFLSPRRVWAWLCALAILWPVALMASDQEWAISIAPGVPSGIAFVDESAEYRLTVEKLTPGPADTELSLTITAPDRETREEQTWPLSFSGPGKQERAITLPTKTKGYWILTTRLMADKKEVATRQSALAVVEKLPNYGRLDPRSFFGTMFIRDPEAAQRIGVKSERAQAVWEWLSPSEGTYSWETLDTRIAKLAEHGIGTVLVIRPEKPPKWALWKSVEELTDPRYLPLFQKFTEDVVARYKDRIQAIEVVNEPDLEVARGSSGQVPITQIYATILQTAYQSIRKISPDLPVIGLDVSGVDFPNLRFSREVLGHGTGSMNIMGGHPYTNSRYLGADSRAESPDAIDTPGRFAAMARLMQEHQIPPRIWSTEFGWGLHKDEPLDSPATNLLAAYVAQAITLTRTVPEVEKLFWFSMFFPGYEGGYTYGLFHGESPAAYPTPGAAAYASCARFLDNVRFVREFPLQGFGKVLRFADQSTGDGVFVLWLSEPRSVGGEVRMPVPNESFTDIEVTDALGREVAGDWIIRALPTFVRIKAADADRLEQAIRTTPTVAREGLLIERVYLSDDRHLQIDITNNTDSAVPVKIFARSQPATARSRSLPQGSSTVTLPLVDTLKGRGELPLELLEDASGKRRVFSLSYDLTPVTALSQVQIDADLGETSALTPAFVNTRESVMPPDPGVDWKGPQDLSMQTWAAWTPDGLYLAIKVVDDVATESPAGDAHFWRRDSLQIGWDMGNRAESGYDEHSRELGVYRTPEGTAVCETYPQVRGRTDISARSRREEGATVYEMLIPWSTLGVSDPAAGRAFRMNIIANDNDGRERKCWIGLSPGIGESKRPFAFRQWVLEAPATPSSKKPNP